MDDTHVKDTRLTRQAFEEMKESGELSFGQVPALRIVGEKNLLIQSASILRYVGKLAGLYPLMDHILAAKIDALMDEETDLFMGLTVSRYPFRFGFDAVGLAGVKDRACPNTSLVRAKLNEDVLPRHLGHLEKILSESPSGWLAGTSGPTIADLQYAPRLCWMLHENDGISPDLLAGFPRVAEFLRKTYSIPEIQCYYKTRGKTFDLDALRLANLK